MAQYNGKQAFTIPRPIRQKNGVNIEAITADKTLSYLDSQYQLLTNNKGSTATIKVPVEKDGSWFWFHCDSSSGHAFVIQTSGGSPIIGGPGLGVGKSALLVCDGSQWAVAFQQA